LRKVKKTVYTVSIDNYAKSVTDITFPFMKAYAHKIGAKFHVIDNVKFKRCPITGKFQKWPGRYEKFQIYKLGREHQNDWNIYLDSDALVHPDMLDITTYIEKDMVLHNGRDVLGNRYREDVYTYRDGRHISSCNWLAIASDWCLDLWHPLEDMTFDEACKNIFPTAGEINQGVKPVDLIDDYVMSRNIARYGLKFNDVIGLLKKECGYDGNFMLHHLYAISEAEKVAHLRQCLKNWGVV
jgi:hypothetical protein